MIDFAYSQEIDATKSILFKTEMKRLNETLLRQNEAEQVLLTAMNVSFFFVSFSHLNKINQIDFITHAK